MLYMWEISLVCTCSLESSSNADTFCSSGGPLEPQVSTPANGKRAIDLVQLTSCAVPRWHLHLGATVTLGMDTLVTLSSSNTNGIMLWAWILWSPCPPRTRTELCFGHGYSGHPVLLERERNYALGMDTLVTLSSSNTNGIMLWAWILWSPCPPRTRTELCFGHGYSGHPVLLEHERNYALGMDTLVTLSSSNTNGIMLWAWILWSPCPPRTRTELCFGHGYSGHPVLLEHERNYALGMDTLVTLSSSNTNGIMLWAWILWSPCPPRARTELCFGHGYSGHPVLLEHERNYALGMDTLVTLSSSNTSGIMLWAWILWSPCPPRTRTELCFGHGYSGHPVLLEHERNYALGMDTLVTLSSSNTNGIMLWAWILWSPCPPRTRTELCFGHGYSGHPVLLEHERNYALGMDTLVTLSSSNTNGIMLWAWILWSPCPPRTRTELCFGHGYSGHPVLLEHERNYALGMDTLVTLSSSNTNGIMLWAWILWSPCPPRTRTELCFGHGYSGHPVLLEHERNYALGMDTLVTLSSSNTNGIMLWAWILWSPCPPRTRTELCFGHGYSGHPVLLEHERNYALGMDTLVTLSSSNTNGIMLWAWILWSPCPPRTRAELCFGHGYSGHPVLLEHERNYALGMDTLVTLSSSNTNGIMLWAWILWSPCPPRTRTELCFGHGYSGHPVLLEHERNYALGMDTLVTLSSSNTNGIMLWAWILWSR